MKKHMMRGLILYETIAMWTISVVGCIINALCDLLLQDSNYSCVFSLVMFVINSIITLFAIFARTNEGNTVFLNSRLGSFAVLFVSIIPQLP